MKNYITLGVLTQVTSNFQGECRYAEHSCKFALQISTKKVINLHATTDCILQSTIADYAQVWQPLYTTGKFFGIGPLDRKKLTMKEECHHLHLPHYYFDLSGISHLNDHSLQVLHFAISWQLHKLLCIRRYYNLLIHQNKFKNHTFKTTSKLSLLFRSLWPKKESIQSCLKR